MTPIAAPTLQPLLQPRTAAPVTRQAPAAVQLAVAATAPHNGAERLDPADCAALRELLLTVGHFEPEPPDPPWSDPRPDLAADHDRWLALLAAAYHHDGQDPYGVYGALNGMRCCSARLAIIPRVNRLLLSAGPPPSWRLVRGDEMTEAEYQRYRASYLAPHTEVLTKLLTAPTAAR